MKPYIYNKDAAREIKDTIFVLKLVAIVIIVFIVIAIIPLFF